MDLRGELLHRPTTLVTGATSGIGRATALALGALGHRVLAHGRRPAAVGAVVARIREAGGAADPVLADLADLEDVRAAAQRLLDTESVLDGLVSNAGGYQPTRCATVQGHEWCFGVNHLAGYALVRMLLPLLAASQSPRVVVVSSVAHEHSLLHAGDLTFQKRKLYWGYRAYANSKLCQLAATLELARHLASQGIAVDAVHPGTVSTGFGQDEQGFFQRLFDVGRFIMRTPEQGADTVVWLAHRDTPLSDTGGYWMDRRRRRPARSVRDPGLGAEVLALSDQLVGELPPLPEAR